MKLVNPPRSVEDFVYHYTKLDTALNFILKSGTIRLNPFSCVNDPRESKSWTIAVSLPLSQNPKTEDWDAASARISNALKGYAKLACFSLDRENCINRWHPDGLLGRGFARPSMWHHYADKHTGVCLMFDRAKLDRTFRKQIGHGALRSSKVEYSDDGSLMDLESHPFLMNMVGVDSRSQYLERLTHHVNKFLPQLFFQKLTDWSHEEEYRWVYFDQDARPCELSFDDSLAAIVIGGNSPRARAREVLKHCVKYETEVATLEWISGYPRLANIGMPHITHQHLIVDETSQ